MATSAVSTGAQELAGYQGVQPTCVGQTLNSTLSTRSTPEFEGVYQHPLCCEGGSSSPGEECWTTHSFTTPCIVRMPWLSQTTFQENFRMLGNVRIIPSSPFTDHPASACTPPLTWSSLHAKKARSMMLQL